MVALALAMLVAASVGTVSAQDATWLANPGTGDFNTAANWSGGSVPTGTAFFDASSTTSLTFSLSITSIGGWTFNAGAGAYTFTNAVGQAISFTGGGIVVNGGSATIVNNSSVQFNNNSTAGDAAITNDGGLYFDNSSTAGNAAITNNQWVYFLNNSTAGNARLINNAGGVVSFFSTAGPLGDGQISAGSIEGAGDFWLGTNTLTVGGNGLSTEVSGAISDLFPGGSLIKIGAGTLTLSGVNTYTGDTTVNAGTLNVAGSLLSSVVVNAGGTLAGIGTVGGLALNSGGILAPGNSIGTVTVVGDAAFNSGSVYRVEVAAPNQSDRLSVTGTATINGGAVQVSKLSPEASYQSGQTYRILDAGTLVRNADFSLNQPFLFLDASLGYGTDYVDLLLAAKAAPSGGIFSTVALTPNQSQAAAALGGLAQSGDALAVYNHFLAMTDADRARRAIDLSSGEVHASGWHVLGQSSELFSRTLRHQGLAGVGMGAGPDALVPETDGGDAGLVVDDLHPRPCGTWAAPLGSHGRVGGDGNAARLEWWNAGLAGGFEGLLGDGGAVGGFAFGYLRSEGSVDDRLSRLEADGLHLGTYAAWTDGAWTVNGAFSYAATQLSTERRNVALMGRTA
ncbi:MAG TPA: autotransporter domain-containing protein, partial [Bacteroidia bacterium]|nr:autotransporter domain-containing protein [Bacteroidia bacterium]